LKRRGIDSHNEVYNFSLFEERIAVSLIKFHVYRNNTKTYPEFEMELNPYLVDLCRRMCIVSFRSGLWMQPYDQRFSTNTSRPGGIVALKASTEVSTHMEVYVGIEGKTKGWVAGNLYLEKNCSAVVGIILK
jgi:hypothetical protein